MMNVKVLNVLFKQKIEGCQDLSRDNMLPGKMRTDIADIYHCKVLTITDTMKV